MLSLNTSAAIDIMRGVKADRKCFRMIGGVLVERTTGEVLPALDHNREQVGRPNATISALSTAKSPTTFLSTHCSS